MSDRSAIEWTDATWNPIRGCSRVSEGCRNCYAERMAARFSGRGQPYEGLARMTADGPRWTGAVRMVPAAMGLPLRWRRGRRVFVNSMSDLFHDGLDDEEILAVFGVMQAAGHHTFQVLTKRPARMRALMSGDGDHATEAGEAASRAFGEGGSSSLSFGAGGGWPPKNVWLGVSVEDQVTADARIPELLATPAVVRFVSYEPALGPVDFSRWLESMEPDEDAVGPAQMPDWIIVGGESGPGARPMHPEWARSVRDQCRGAGVPFFMKQWGEWGPRDLPWETDTEASEAAGGIAYPHVDPLTGGSVAMVRVGKGAAGRLLDGREWNEMPR